MTSSKQKSLRYFTIWPRLGRSLPLHLDSPPLISASSPSLHLFILRPIKSLSHHHLITNSQSSSKLTQHVHPHHPERPHRRHGSHGHSDQTYSSLFILPSHFPTESPTDRRLQRQPSPKARSLTSRWRNASIATATSAAARPSSSRNPPAMISRGRRMVRSRTRRSRCVMPRRMSWCSTAIRTGSGRRRRVRYVGVLSSCLSFLVDGGAAGWEACVRCCWLTWV